MVSVEMRIPMVVLDGYALGTNQMCANKTVISIQLLDVTVLLCSTIPDRLALLLYIICTELPERTMAVFEIIMGITVIGS